MIKSTVIAIIFLAASCISYGQNNALIKGKWKYAAITGTTDSTTKNMMEMMFGSMSIYFADNGRYKAVMLNRPEEGNWQLTNDTTITLTSDKGQQNDMYIESVTEKNLAVKFGAGPKGQAIILSKTVAGPGDEISPAQKPAATVSATMQQVAKKWFLKRMEIAGKTEAQLNRLAILSKGSFYGLKNDGSYNYKTLAFTGTGKWQFGQGNTSIILQAEDERIIWNIFSISDNEMAIIPGNKSDKWILGTEE